MRRLAKLLAVCALTVGGQALAAEDPDAKILQTLNAVGFRGIWAPDCYRTVSQGNPRIRIDLAWLGTPSIVTQKTTVPMEDEMMSIEAAQIVQPDTIVLQLTLVSFGEAGWSFDRTDTYQKYGARLRLMRSEVTRSTPQSQAEGHMVGVVVDRGMSPAIPTAQSYRPMPMLERCAE